MDYQRLDHFVLPKHFRGKPGWYTQLWWIIEKLFFAFSPQFMYGWRRFLLRCFGASVGKKVLIRPSVHTQFPWKLSIGDYSWIGDGVTFYNLEKIIIGSHVVLSQNTYVCTGTHAVDKISFDIYAKPIIIEDQCWIASDVFIAPGITIGRASVVGARSNVLHSLPPEMICYGSPAKPVKKR